MLPRSSLLQVARTCLALRPEAERYLYRSVLLKADRGGTPRHFNAFKLTMMASATHRSLVKKVVLDGEHLRAMSSYDDVQELILYMLSHLPHLACLSMNLLYWNPPPNDFGLIGGMPLEEFHIAGLVNFPYNIFYRRLPSIRKLRDERHGKISLDQYALPALSELACHPGNLRGYANGRPIQKVRVLMCFMIPTCSNFWGTPCDSSKSSLV